MAAQKSIAKQAEAPRRAAKAGSTPARKGARKSRSPRNHRSPEPRCKSRAEESRLVAEDLLELLSSRLDLIETISLALRTLEDRPDVGPICSALEQGVRELSHVHEAVGLYLQGHGP